MAVSRDEALDLLSVAGGACLDNALEEVARHSKQDLAAAYLTRFERRRDPVDLLRALKVAKGFNLALAQEWLGLTREAIHSWNEVTEERSPWAAEAKRHLEQLQRRRPDVIRHWSPDELTTAIQSRDAGALAKIARLFPVETARFFERSDLRNRDSARLLAKALAATGERYPEAVVDAMDRAKDRAALEQGLIALQARDYARAVTLLERAGNPLALAARYFLAADERSLQTLDPVLPHLGPRYRELSSRIRMFRANLLENGDRFLEAHADYERALLFANGDPTLTAAILGRRSFNYATIGNAEEAFRDAFRALPLLNRVVDTNTRNTAYGSAAMAARQLGHPQIALHYQNAAVESAQRAIGEKSAPATVKLELAVALRHRAEIHVELEDLRNAEGDLRQAADLAEAAENPDYRDQLRMRLHDVRGQALLKRHPAGAVASFTEALALANEQPSTYRAILHFQRATARRNAGDHRADEDIATALNILRNEVRHAIETNPTLASKPLWTPYFSRFRAQYNQLIAGRIEARDIEGAFVHSEQARAFEPMQILLQSGSVPPGFRPIETVAGFREARAALPSDTVILQFLVLPKRTYTWVITRERIVSVQQRARRADIEGWVADAQAGVDSGQRDSFTRAMRAAYAELFREPLKQAGASKTRVVIIPDEPMQGLPFSGLAGTREEGHLIERASIATAGSTSLYLYALARDRQMSSDRNPSVLLIGDPPFPAYPRLPFAKAEVDELARHYYRDAEVLTGTDATALVFLAKAKDATIIHFAGHALANGLDPWQSRLLFAGESGELSAQKLMQKLPVLERTRLVVLGACSTAGGVSVGPQGLAPLVRPLIAAKVPAVVGSMWNARDASARELLVFFHCHYRHGDDVAVALRKAQLEMLRNNEPAMRWAAFQAVGYATSPYARPIALEDPTIEHLCRQNSLQRPDGLHPQ